MSTLEVGKIVPATGTAITLGESGDTLTVPSGGNLTVASGATINITGATQTGFPAAGLAIASQWRLTTDFTGDKAPIDGNLEQVDAPVGFGVLGSSMTESSGIFTFPATGYWLIKFHAYFLANTNSLYNRITIQTTTNNATYAVAAVTSGAATGGDINIKGGDGLNLDVGAVGGSSMLGSGGGSGWTGATVSYAGSGYGSGGGAGYNVNGKAGAAGIVIVWEYK